MKNKNATLLTAGLFFLCISSAISADEGKLAFDTNCAKCHEPAINGAPDFNDKADWDERMHKGINGMVKMVITGVQGYGGSMPPRGGNEKLTDIEIKSAVNYMINRINISK